jgi:hypothetical protein
MSCSLNLQRNTKVFYSTVDLYNAGGTPAAITSFTPSNTWEIEVLAGYAVSQAAATQDIQAFESGTSPDRSSTRFNTIINPVDWSFNTYLRPTNHEAGSNVGNLGVNGVQVSSDDSKPLSDWFMWQACMSNIAPATGTSEQSAWEKNGTFTTNERVAIANQAAHSSNFGSIQENQLYFQMDNVFYQVVSASVNQAEVDAAIDGIANTTWTGFGTQIRELTGAARAIAVAVFGGYDNSGVLQSANANFTNVSAIGSYHPYNTYNVAGTTTTAAFIKNRLSTIDLGHATGSSTPFVNYTFPVTSLTWSWNNNVSFLTPEILNSLDSPIGNFAGAREIRGTFTAYLKQGATASNTLLKNIIEDSRVSHSSTANANIIVGTNTTGPYVAFYMPAVQFSFPVHTIEDIISVSVDYQAQEPATNCGTGGEVDIFIKHA